MKSLLYLLEKPPQDSINERVDAEPISKKYWLNFTLSIVFLLLSSVIAILTLAKRNESPAVTYQVDMVNKTQEKIITLPYAHQSYMNVSNWVEDAVMNSYSFDFSNYYDQVKKAEFYYTPEGYNMYKKALEGSKLEEIVVNKIQVSIVPNQSPIQIKSGRFGETTFWRFRVPASVSYYGGKNPIVESRMVEVLVIRVPSYQNPKGLAISEFNMKAL